MEPAQVAHDERQRREKLMSASRMGARLVPVLASVHDRRVRNFPLIRSSVMKDSRLFLALMADGGTYPFEPFPPTKPAGVSAPKP